MFSTNVHYFTSWFDVSQMIVISTATYTTAAHEALRFLFYCNNFSVRIELMLRERSSFFSLSPIGVSCWFRYIRILFFVYIRDCLVSLLCFRILLLYVTYVSFVLLLCVFPNFAVFAKLDDYNFVVRFCGFCCFR